MILPSKLTLANAIRQSLIAENRSYVKVTQAVNSALGELKHSKHESKTGLAKASIKKQTFAISVTELRKFEGKLTLPLLFCAWNDAVQKASDLAEMESVKLPAQFLEWTKFAELKTEELSELAEV